MAKNILFWKTLLILSDLILVCLLLFFALFFLTELQTSGITYHLALLACITNTKALAGILNSKLNKHQEWEHVSFCTNYVF